MNVCHRNIAQEIEIAKVSKSSEDFESYADKKADTPDLSISLEDDVELTNELLTAPRPIGGPNPVEYIHTYPKPQGRTVKSEILSCITLGTLHDIADMVCLTIRDDAAVSILNYIIIEQFL